MNTTISQPLSLKVSRLIKAPRERIFAAWTTPSDIMRWLGSDECKVQSATIDARAGGKYHFVVKGSSDHKMDVTGVYREVKSPERLVFTWNTESCTSDMAGTETVVTVNLTAQNGGTLVEITHEGFPTTETRDNHNYGWTGSLDKLEKLS